MGDCRGRVAGHRGRMITVSTARWRNDVKKDSTGGGHCERGAVCGPTVREGVGREGGKWRNHEALMAEGEWVGMRGESFEARNQCLRWGGIVGG
jgi:hypothetical protein